jgi:hypothetical protein
VAWIVRLVSLGAEGEEHSSDVLQIARPSDLTDLASLGLTLAEGKRLLAGVQQELVAVQSRKAPAEPQHKIPVLLPMRPPDGCRKGVCLRQMPCFQPLDGNGGHVLLLHTSSGRLGC